MAILVKAEEKVQVCGTGRDIDSGIPQLKQWQEGVRMGAVQEAQVYDARKER